MLSYSMIWQYVVAAVMFIFAVILAVVIAKKLKPYCTLKTLCLSVLAGILTGIGLMCYVSSVFAGMGNNRETVYWFLSIGIACLIALIVTVIMYIITRLKNFSFLTFALEVILGVMCIYPAMILFGVVLNLIG